jgi:hypothetical protein
VLFSYITYVCGAMMMMTTTTTTLVFVRNVRRKNNEKRMVAIWGWFIAADYVMGEGRGVWLKLETPQIAARVCKNFSFRNNVALVVAILAFFRVFFAIVDDASSNCTYRERVLRECCGSISSPLFQQLIAQLLAFASSHLAGCSLLLCLAVHARNFN